MKQLNAKISVDMNDLLGKGSTGNVYRGVSTQENQHSIAVKVIPLQQINNQVTSYLLQCQLQALKAISKCSNQSIVKLEQIIVCDNNCYVAMELLEGGTLKDYITESKKLDAQKSLYILHKLLEGYKIIKQNGIVHRDLKPQNILLLVNPKQDNNQIIPKIIDFGYCSMQKVQRKPKMFYNVGSPRYMSPQAYTGNKYSQKSDIWALGIIFYEMLTGTNFDKGKNIVQTFKLIKQKGIPIPSSLNPQCRSILQHMLLLDPNRRHSCQQILRQLNQQQPEPKPQQIINSLIPSYQIIQAPQPQIVKNSLRQLRNTITTQKRVISPLSKSPTIRASVLNPNQSVLKTSGFLTRSVGFNVSPQSRDTHLSAFNSNQLNLKFERYNIFNNRGDKQIQEGPSTERKAINRLEIKQPQIQYKKPQQNNQRLIKYNQNSPFVYRTLHESTSEQNLHRVQNQNSLNRTAERQNIIIDANSSKKPFYGRFQQVRQRKLNNTYNQLKSNEILRLERILTSPNNRVQPLSQNRPAVQNQKINFFNAQPQPQLLQSQIQLQQQPPQQQIQSQPPQPQIQVQIQPPQAQTQPQLPTQLWNISPPPTIHINPQNLPVTQQQQPPTQQISHQQILPPQHQHQAHPQPQPHQQINQTHQVGIQIPQIQIQNQQQHHQQLQHQQHQQHQPISIHSTITIQPQSQSQLPIHQQNTIQNQPNMTNHQLPLSSTSIQQQQQQQQQQHHHFTNKIQPKQQNAILNRNIRILPVTPHNQSVFNTFKSRQTVLNQFHYIPHGNQMLMRPKIIEQTHI